MLSDFLKLSDRIWALPVIHGSGDFAIEVRRVMLAQEFDCLAVPLPPSFQGDVEAAVAELPNLSLVVQPEPLSFEAWPPEESESDDELAADAFASQSEGEQELKACSYVPIDPCQPVIAAIRIAMQERMPRAFIDLETSNFVSLAAFYPDPYPVKQVSIDRFAAALMPTVPHIPEGQPEARVVWMANRLRELEQRHERVLFVCSMMDWPWVKDAFHDRRDDVTENDDVEPAETFANDPLTHLFWLGELPFITGLYEQARQSLDDDENLSIDGVKALLLATRDRYRLDLKSRARKITPTRGQCVQSVRGERLVGLHAGGHDFAGGAIRHSAGGGDGDGVESNRSRLHGGSLGRERGGPAGERHRGGVREFDQRGAACVSVRATGGGEREHHLGRRAWHPGSRAVAESVRRGGLGLHAEPGGVRRSRPQRISRGQPEQPHRRGRAEERLD